MKTREILQAGSRAAHRLLKHGRRSLVTLGLLAASGCGSGESVPPNSTPMPLSIANPASGAKDSAKAVAEATPGKPGQIPDLEDPAVKALVQRANAAVVKGMNAIAVESLSQAIGVAPENAELFRMRADVYVLIGEMANARADFSTAVRLAPLDAELRNVRGYFLMGQGLSQEARQDFDEAVRLNPAFAAAWNNRGLISLAAGDPDLAHKDFEKAIECDRKFADAWNNRGFVRMKQKRHDDAIADIRQAISLKADYATAWNNLGLVCMQKEDYAEAEKAFSRLIELAPMDVRWFNHRRAALLKLEKFTEAQADASTIEWLTELNLLTQKASSNARNPRGWIARGEHLIEAGQYGAAIQDFTRALVVNPGNSDALSGRAYAWLQTGDVQKSLQDCDESIVSLATPRAYSVRGDVWLAMKNFDQAITDYDAASRLDANVAEAYEGRAQVRKDAGQQDLATEDLRKARQIRDALAGKIPKTASTKAEPLE